MNFHPKITNYQILKRTERSGSEVSGKPEGHCVSDEVRSTPAVLGHSIRWPQQWPTKSLDQTVRCLGRPGKNHQTTRDDPFLVDKRWDFFRRWHGTMGWHVFVKYSTCVYFWVDPNTVCTCVSLFFSKLLSESLSLSKTLWPRCFYLTRKETTKSSFLDSMLKTSQESLMFPVPSATFPTVGFCKKKRGLIVEEDVVMRLSDWLSCEVLILWGVKLTLL